MVPYIFFQTDKGTIESFIEETIRTERSFEVMAESLEGPPPFRRRRIKSAEETLLPVLGAFGSQLRSNVVQVIIECFLFFIGVQPNRQPPLISSSKVLPSFTKLTPKISTIPGSPCHVTPLNSTKTFSQVRMC